MARRKQQRRATTAPVFREDPTPEEVLAHEGIEDPAAELGRTIVNPREAMDPARVGDWRARDVESVGWSDVPAVHEWPAAPRDHTPDANELARWAMTPPPGVLADVLAEWPDPDELATEPAPRRPRAERVARWLVPAAFVLVAGLFVVGTVAG